MGKMGYGPHSFRAGFERRGLGSGQRTNRPQKGFWLGSTGHGQKGVEARKNWKKYVKAHVRRQRGRAHLVYLEQESLLLTNCAKPFEEKTFVEALGAKGQVRALGPEELKKKFLSNTIGAKIPEKISLCGC